MTKSIGLPDGEEIMSKHLADYLPEDVSSSQNALMFGVREGYINTTELLEAGANPNVSLKHPHLLIACTTGNVDMVKLLLRSGAHVNATDQHGNTALMAAIAERCIGRSNIDNPCLKDVFIHSENDYLTIIALLLEAQIDINKVNTSCGQTALIVASYLGDCKVVDVLLKNDADPNLHDNNGSTALMVASENGHPEVVQLLISAGADLNMTMTPLISLSKREEITSKVLAHYLPKYASSEMKIDMKAMCQENLIGSQNALTIAVRERHISTTELLLEAGANPNVNLNHPPLLIACVTGNVEMVKLLLHSGAHVNATGQLGETALMAVIEGRQIKYRYSS